MRHARNLRLVIFAVLTAMSTHALASTVPVDLREAASDFTLIDAKGHPFMLSQFKGKVVLLNFWATWCHGCKTEIPWYVDFQSTYNAAGLSVIGISMDESWKPVVPFIQEQKVNYLVALGNDDLTKQYNVSSMPVSLLIDREGRIAEWHVGVVDRTLFEQDITTLLKERK